MTHGLHIVVKCPDCGEARVSPQEVTVRNCVDNGMWSYRFQCPSCGRRTTGQSVMSALMDAVDAGAGFEPWTMPAELHERPDGPPFTLSDVLKLHLMLLEPDWFDEFSRCDRDADR